ncbi:MAG: hypothetical protein IJQ69_05480 [Bacteroidales bacterium]|nr:hypothetical protein [Bacteroidales bacterium]
MSEETLKDPRDLNSDGKVSLDEKLKCAAAKASKKFNEVADEMVDNAKDLYDKASPKAKEIIGEVKENTGKLMDDAAGLMDKAKDKIDSLKK